MHHMIGRGYISLLGYRSTRMLNPSLLVTPGGNTPPPPEQHLVMATETETCMVSKRVVCILLERCLVMSYFLRNP